MRIFPLLTCVVALAGQPDVRVDTTKVLWRDPGSIGAKDLFWGPGSPDRVPQAPFNFIKEDTSGTKPKIEVVDNAGVRWTVKLATVKPEDNEVHAELAASRLVWALGYFADENYFVPEGTITGATGLRRAAEVINPDGRFLQARFERTRADAETVIGLWDVEANPFNGTRELSGLQILMMVIGNWDVRPANAVTLRVALPSGDKEDRYLLSDLGTAFGRMSGGVGKTHTRWNLSDYTDSQWLAGLAGHQLQFRTPLTGTAPLTVPVEHAKWFVSLTAQLTPEQVRRAFEASGARAEEIDGFSRQVSARLERLRAVLDKAK